jgi:gluconate 2-dehydrogenase gamma chain
MVRCDGNDNATKASKYSALVFLNEHEAETVEAMAARLIPCESDSPGAREADAIVYIDRALSGFFDHLQVFYRRGIEALDLMCMKRYKAYFRCLSDVQQDHILELIDGSREGNQPPLAEFFAVVREHTLEGFFGDPAHGGNRDTLGWKLIGFPGAQWGYSREQMAPGFDARKIPVVTMREVCDPGEQL